MLGVLGTLGIAAPAIAQPDLRAQARRHFDQGVALFEAGDLQAALGEFEAAQGLHPHPRILRNIAATQEALLRYLDAIATFERYIADPQTSAQDRRDGEAHLRELRALLARVELAVTPEGAEIWVDERLVGQAPLARPVEMASGNHRVEVRRQGFRTERRQFGIAAGAATRLAFTLQVQPARLRLESNAPGGRVRVDDAAERATPSELELAPGRHVIRARAPGFASLRQTVELQPGEARTLTLVLARPTGTLEVALRPPGARLFVDGELRRLGPGRRLRADAGLHRLRVDALDRIPWEHEVRIVPDRTQRLDVALGRDRIYVRPGYFWTGAVVTGALVIGAIIASVRAFVLADEFRQNPTYPAFDESVLANNICYSLLGLTAVSAATTGVLFFFSRGEPPEPQVRGPR